MVEINHGGGYSTRYAHNQENLVKVGDIVSKGQTIALMGSSGRSTGPHVHYEVYKNGRPVDPASYVRRTRR
jgi:murein DD-endopeptidase MepM/ murein hydrolase activator NlpD